VLRAARDLNPERAFGRSKHLPTGGGHVGARADHPRTKKVAEKLGVGAPTSG
jgi:hypothetical protein